MKVYVGNLSKDITDQQLNELASPYGTPVSANVAVERPGGQSKGFGFVQFNTEEEAKAAIIGLNGRDVNGQAINVSEAKSKRERTEN